jgi:hypothetical protein
MNVYAQFLPFWSHTHGPTLQPSGGSGGRPQDILASDGKAQAVSSAAAKLTAIFFMATLPLDTRMRRAR